MNLNMKDLSLLGTHGYLSSSELNYMGENVIGTFQLPYSVATNFIVNNKEYLVPFVTEESSVVAAASFGAKIARKHGGFIASSVPSIMTGQIQVKSNSQSDERSLLNFLSENKKELLKKLNKIDPVLIKFGGGACDIQPRTISTKVGKMIIIHLDVDVRDAMGANAVNSMVEKLAEIIKTELSIRSNLRIITNLAIKRIAKCKAIFDSELLGGQEIIDNIMNAYEFAEADPFRATTHNKGIMNGISAFALATGNDTRAIEASAHVFAMYRHSFTKYGPLTHYYKDQNGRLVGEIEIPLPMGSIGGLTQKHPMVRFSLKLLEISHAEQLSQIAAAVGLAQNIAALRALASEGIQAGHMKLHERKNQQLR